MQVPSIGVVPFAISEYEDRLRRVCAALDERGLDALIAFAIQLSLPGHVTWLAGSEPRLGLTVSSMAVVVPKDPRPLRVLILGWIDPNPIWVDEVHHGFDFLPMLRETLPSGLRRIGIAGLEMFPTNVYLGLVQAHPQTQFEPASDLLLTLRQTKSAAEVEVMRTASRIAQIAVEAMYALVRSGITERELLATYERTARAEGSDELPYATQVGSGPATALVTAHATDRVLREGDLVRSDSGALYRGYCSDISRGTSVGPAQDRAKDVLEAAAEVYEEGLRMIKPGVRFADLVAAAKKTAARYGLAEQLGTMIVHGIGCNQDEYPHWSTGPNRPSRWVRAPGNVEVDRGFTEGMVCCYEPGIYVPGLGGIRMEEPFVVTATGIERLAPGLPIRLWETRPTS
jgi:Xaa-Pro aminopeptidase